MLWWTTWADPRWPKPPKKSLRRVIAGIARFLVVKFGIYAKSWVGSMFPPTIGHPCGELRGPTHSNPNYPYGAIPGKCGYFGFFEGKIWILRKIWSNHSIRRSLHGNLSPRCRFRPTSPALPTNVLQNGYLRVARAVLMQNSESTWKSTPVTYYSGCRDTYITSYGAREQRCFFLTPFGRPSMQGSFNKKCYAKGSIFSSKLGISKGDFSYFYGP